LHLWTRALSLTSESEPKRTRWLGVLMSPPTLGLVNCDVGLPCECFTFRPEMRKREGERPSCWQDSHRVSQLSLLSLLLNRGGNCRSGDLTIDTASGLRGRLRLADATLLGPRGFWSLVILACSVLGLSGRLAFKAVTFLRISGGEQLSPAAMQRLHLSGHTRSTGLHWAAKPGC